MDAIADESGEPAVLVVAVGKAGTLFTENGDLKPGVPATFLKADYRRTKPENLFSMVRSLIAKFHYAERDAEGMGYYIQWGMVQNHISGEAFARWQPDPPQA